MTTRQNRARDLRREGWSYERIADELGVGIATVYADLNPEYREQNRQACRDYKAAHRDELRAYDEAYAEAHRRVCSRCGEKKMFRQAKGDVCRDCIAARTHERALRICALWSEGLPRDEVARTVGLSPERMSVEMSRLRKLGYDLPRRGPGGRPSAHSVPFGKELGQ